MSRSTDQHREHSAGHRATARVIVVSSSRATGGDDESGALVTERLEGAGHRVLSRHVVPDEPARIRAALAEAVGDGKTDLLVFTGGTGVSRRDATPDTLRAHFDVELPGFGELFRALSFQEIGSAAMLSRATAGLVGPVAVFAVPGSPAACALALDKLILPELSHLLGELSKEGRRATPDVSTAPEAAVASSAETLHPPEAEPPPPPTGRLGEIGGGRFEVKSEEVVSKAPPTPAPEPDAMPPAGWRRAVYDIEGEVALGEREELPWELEKISPIVDVLHTAGQVGVLKLKRGQKFSVYGWPDLQRPTSRVVAIGWGQPVAEVLALHRHPHLAGTCIEESRGFLPHAGENVAATCEQVTGRAPKDTSGSLFAISSGTVWIKRGSRVIKWDGKKETDDGAPSQVLASLLLHWSNK